MRVIAYGVISNLIPEDRCEYCKIPQNMEVAGMRMLLPDNLFLICIVLVTFQRRSDDEILMLYVFLIHRILVLSSTNNGKKMI
jgi:hypothetical protein